MTKSLNLRIIKNRKKYMLLKLDNLGLKLASKLFAINKLDYLRDNHWYFIKNKPNNKLNKSFMLSIASKTKCSSNFIKF